MIEFLEEKVQTAQAPAVQVKDLDRLRQLGVTMVTLPAADKKTLADLLKDGGAVWAANLDKRGKPGTEVLKAFTAALQSAK